MTLTLSPLEATWRTKQKDPHTKLMVMWGEEEGNTWPKYSSQQKETNWELEPLCSSGHVLAVICLCLAPSYKTVGCLTALSSVWLATLLVVYDLDRCFSLPEASKDKDSGELHMIHEPTPYSLLALRSKPKCISSKENWISQDVSEKNMDSRFLTDKESRLLILTLYK